MGWGRAWLLDNEGAARPGKGGPLTSTPRTAVRVAWSQRRRTDRQAPAPAVAAARHGLTLAATGPTWLRQVEAAADDAHLRADSAESLRAVAWVLATRSRRDRSSAPTWAALVEQTGRSRATVARWLAWLRARGLLAVVTTGAVARGPHEAHQAAVYALTRPAGADAAAPPCPAPPVDEDETPGPEGQLNTQDGREARAGGTETAASPPGWSRTRPAATRAERLRLVERLRDETPCLRGPAGPSTRALRSVLRPWLVEGWTLADLRWAVDHRPDETPWTFEAAPREPLAWLRWRLRPWAEHQAPGRAVERAHAARLAAQEANRQAAAAAKAAAVPVTSEFRAARLALRRAG